jgi:hypothetical protein
MVRPGLAHKKVKQIERLGKSIERRQAANITVPHTDYAEYRLYTGIDLNKK